MTPSLRDSLAQVQELLGLAHQGRLYACIVEGTCCVHRDLQTPGGAGFMVDGETWNLADAEAIAAAVNFLRDHGPELMKMLDRHGAGDAEAWRPIESAPEPGVVHVRGLWVRTTHEGQADVLNFCTYTGWVNVLGDFVDAEFGETFGWESDDYEYWMPLPPQKTDDAARAGERG